MTRKYPLHGYFLSCAPQVGVDSKHIFVTFEAYLTTLSRDILWFRDFFFRQKSIRSDTWIDRLFQGNIILDSLSKFLSLIYSFSKYSFKRFRSIIQQFCKLFPQLLLASMENHIESRPHIFMISLLRNNAPYQNFISL